MAAFGPPPIDSSLAGAKQLPGVDPNSKFAGFDTAGLESLAPQNTPSPDGAASQGALGPPSEGGESSAFPDQEGQGSTGMNMLSIFNESSDEDKDNLVTQVTESYAPHGMSIEGAAENALTRGGPQAWAQAAKFGVNLDSFADKLNPQGADTKLGQAFGSVPSDEQAATNEAFKSTEQATTDLQATMDTQTAESAAKKLEQRRAIAAFLIEAGLRTLASNREDVGGAMAEGALGTMEAGRKRKSEARDIGIADAARERKIQREDASDEAAKLRAQQQTDEFEYKKSQRGAEEKKRDIGNLQEVTNEEGETYFFDPTDPKVGKWVTDADGNRVKSADVGLSKAQIETSKRAYNRALNTKVEKIKGLDEFERVQMYPETEGLEGKGLRDTIIEIAAIELADQAGEEEDTINYLDY